MMNRMMLLSAVFACALSARAESVEIMIYNPAGFARENEIAEIDESAVKSRLGSPFFVLTDSEGKEIPWQKTHDGKILFPVNVAAGGSAVYVAAPGVPQPVTPLVYGRLFPERADDMTWENDNGAYRAYGPGQQKNGDRTFGYDIWTKSVPDLVLEKRYIGNNRQGKTFHRDYGEGMDVYTVGPTLGGGTNALLDDSGEIIYPWCFSEYEIIEHGPLRFQVRLVYPPATAEKGIPAAEQRVITLDAGDWFNRTDVTYYGLDSVRDMVAGQVVHIQNPEGYVLDKENNAVAYADLTENAEAGNGTIYLGMLSVSDSEPLYMPLPAPAGDAVGHVVLKGKVKNAKPFTYYWGAGWSKGGVPSMDAWRDKIERKRMCLDNPLRIKVISRK